MTGGLIRRSCTLALLCYVAVTAGLIHRPTTQLPAASRRAARGCGKLPTPSKQLAIDDESGMLGDLVIERSRGEVGFVGLPVDARRSGEPCLLINPLDQRATDAFAARGLRGEQILQIAQRLDRGGAAVKEIMRKPEQFAAALGDKAVHGLVSV